MIDKILDTDMSKHGCNNCMSGGSSKELQSLQGLCTSINTIPRLVNGAWYYGIGLNTTISSGTPNYTIYWFKFPPGVTPNLTVPPSGDNLIAMQCCYGPGTYNYGYTIPITDTPGFWSYGAYIEDSASPPCSVYNLCTVQVITPTPSPTPVYTPTPSPTPVYTPTPSPSPTVPIPTGTPTPVITPTPSIPPTDICTWIQANGGIHPMPIANISTLVKGYLGYQNLGFNVVSAYISGAVAYYLNVPSSGNSLTGCNFS